MTDPSQDTPPTLVERLRKTASYLAAGCVIPAKPQDGGDDPSDPVDDVTFEVEELRDLASLYATAADALEEKLGEVARLGARLANELSAQADPPNRAPLLTSLEERVTAGATMAPETVEVIRDAIAAIRTDARVIEAAREKLKGWHAWARKLGRAEGDEYASAMPATLQARISGQVEAGQLALLEKLDKAGIDRETALAWIEVCGTAGFGQAPTPASPPDRKREFFRKLQDSETARDHHADLRYAMGHTARKPTSAEVEQTHTDLQRLAFGQQHSSDLNALHAVLTSLLNAEPTLDLVDPATGEPALEGEGGLEMAARLLTLARQRGAFDQRPVPSDPPSPPGYTPWISMGNSGWALDGVRVADDVIGAWAHYAGLWTRWARELAGCSDGTDEELRGYIARLVGRLHMLRAQNLDKLDSPQ